MKVFNAFFEYTKWMSAMASCKSKGGISSTEQRDYFNFHYIDRLSKCHARPKDAMCSALCKYDMPWNGITSMELKLWGHLQPFLNNIKTVFKDYRYTEQSDTIITTWKTKQDAVIQTNFKEVYVTPTGFNITDYFDSENSGLSLERLGFVNLKEWVKQQDSIHYSAGVMKISLWGVVAVIGTFIIFNTGW
jgi:hypothetical protein